MSNTKIRIDSREFGQGDGYIVSNLERSFEKVSHDGSSGRTTSGSMDIDLLGTFYNYKMTISRRSSNPNLVEFDELWDALSAPVPFNMIEVPYNQSTWRFEAYITKGKQLLISSDSSGNYWGSIELSFIARAPQRKPDEEGSA